jgi:hypothetical protein
MINDLDLELVAKGRCGYLIFLCLALSSLDLRTRQSNVQEQHGVCKKLTRPSWRLRQRGAGKYHCAGEEQWRCDCFAQHDRGEDERNDGLAKLP